MGGGGGTAGAVEFPQYIMETHGRFLAGTGIDADGNFDSAISNPSKSILELFDEGLNGSNPYDIAGPPAPGAHFDEGPFRDFETEIDGYSTSSIDDIVSSALRATNRTSVADFEDIGLNLTAPTNIVQEGAPTQSISVSDPTTSIGDPSVTVGDPASGLSFPTLTNDTELESSLSTTALDLVSSAKTEIVNLLPDSATEEMGEFINRASDELAAAGVLRTTDAAQLITDAKTDAETILQEAIDVAARIANTQEITDVVNEFSTRRDSQEQQQIAQFNARMADAGAVNSSAYGIGLALIQEEHVRAESEFDAQLSLEAFNRGLQQYIQTYVSNLDSASRVELSNDQQYNQLVGATVELMVNLDLQGKLTRSDLAQLYSTILANQIDAHLQRDQVELQKIEGELAQGQLELAADELEIQNERLGLEASSQKLEKEQLRYQARQVELGLFQADLEKYGLRIQEGQVQLAAEELQVQADSRTRQLQEQRYIRSLQGTLQLLTNRREFHRILAELRREQDEVSYQAELNETELVSALGREKEIWEFTLAEEAMNVLASPSGMARRLPRQKATWEKVTGKAIQGAAAAASVVGAASDRRLKENIRRIGHHPFGFGIYLFDYKWGPSNIIGCIAQEVGEVLPEAVGKRNGDFFVRYSLL